jgi:hypothetical protein
MAGVKIPDFTSLGQMPTPTAPDSVAKVDNLEAAPAASAQQYAKVFEAGSQLQDLYNKSAVNNAYINFNSKLNDAAANYYSLKGSNAVDGLPAFNAQVAQLKQNAMSGVIGTESQTQLQNMMERSSENHLFRSAQHADQEASVAAAQTHSSMLSNFVDDAMTNIGDPKIYQQRMQDGAAEIQGYGQKTGQSTDTIQAETNNFNTKMAETKYRTMADQNVNTAYADFQANKNSLPPNVQVKLDAWFKPQVRDSAVDAYVNNLPTQLSQISSTSGTGVSPNNLGNVKTASGAANNTADFINPATPVDGVIIAANNLRNNYQGLTLQQIGAKWTGEPAKTASWVAAASKTSGIAPDTVPNLNDPTQLQAVLKGMNIAENSSSKAASFTDDIISQGVQASLGGKQADITAPANNPTPTSAFQTTADAMAANRPALLEQARQWAQQNFPNDPAMENKVKQRVDNVISANVSAQTATYRQDNQTVMRAISGDMTNGEPPTSYQQLMAIPGVGEVVKRVAVQDSKFYDGIDRMIGQMASKNTTTNSPNGFDTIMRSTDPINPVTMGPGLNSIDSQDKLNSLLGRSDGNGINMKDYNDAKPLMEVSQPVKDYIHQNMQAIVNANGNVDGQGQARALQWYHQALQSYQTASKAPGFDETDYLKNATETQGPEQQSFMASRMEQISNWAKSIFSGTASSAQAAQPQTATVISPTGQTGTIPIGNLDKALATGYKRAQ